MESVLKLTIEKGPRKGETLEFTSRSTIRIGRVVTGNTIAIKDAGISSKHICIKFDCKWLLSDLDSSNGTFLNDDQLNPSEPVEINDGDTIKLGEVTSIKVRIDRNGERQVYMNLRKGRGKVETDVVGDGEEEKNKAVGKPPRRGRQKKVPEIIDKPCNVVVEVEEISIGAPVLRQTRSTRNSNKAGNVDLGMNESNLKELEKAVPAKRRKRILQDDSVSEDLTMNEINLKEPQRARRGGRRQRILQNNVSENLDEERTELPVRVENLGHESIQKNSPLKENLEAGKSVNFGEECGQDKENSTSKAVEMDVSGEKDERTSNIRQEDAEEVATSSGVKENYDKVLESPDLEKMTLGDWFDYLEVALPKEIHDEAEKLILDMRKKAAQFQEFMLQQRNAKA